MQEQFDSMAAVVPYGPLHRSWHETLSSVAVNPNDGSLLVLPPRFDPLNEDAGTMDKKTPEFNRCHPIVALFNYGTTIKGSCDDVKTAGERLVHVLKNGMYKLTLQDPSDTSKSVVHKQCWFHVD